MTGIHWLCRGKTEFLLSITIWPKKAIFSCPTKLLSTFLKVPGKVFKVGGKVRQAWGKSTFPTALKTFPPALKTFPPTLKTFPGTFIAVRTAQNSTQKVCRTRENSLLCSYCNRREKFNFPPLFPLQSQCIPVIHGFYLECLASLDIQTEAIHDRKTLTFWGKSGGKQNFSLLLKYSQRK